MSPLREALAAALHDECCRWDHTDQCSWLYERDWPEPWSHPTHKTWLATADRILAVHPDITLAEVTQFVAARQSIRDQLNKWWQGVRE